jgi:FKBP-type peptidyl-prolyl cis-trans isomerase
MNESRPATETTTQTETSTQSTTENSANAADTTNNDTANGDTNSANTAANSAATEEPTASSETNTASSNPAVKPGSTDVKTSSSGTAKDVTELQKVDVVVGKGKEAKAGNRVTVHYRGRLTDGTVFDESYKRGQPFEFNLGAGEVIQGWDKGVAGMKEGGKRKLTIPPHLGYGPNGAGGTIPPNATLIFDVELLNAG